MNTIKRKEESLRNKLFQLDLKIESQPPMVKTLHHIKFLITQEENKVLTKMTLMMTNIFNH